MFLKALIVFLLIGVVISLFSGLVFLFKDTDREGFRRGRNLELTELGKLVHRYADEIFQTGQEMVDAVRGRPTGRRG